MGRGLSDVRISDRLTEETPGGPGGGILDALPFGAVTARGPQLWRLMIGF